MCCLLLRRGADASLCSTGGSLALHYLMKRGKPNGNDFDNFSFVNCFCTTENYDEVIIAMMRNKADINAKNLNDSPLHIACINGNIGAVKVLIQRGAQLDMPST